MTDSVSPVATAVLPTTMRVVSPVRPVDPTPDAPARDSSGKPPPDSGEELPPAAPTTKQSLTAAAERLNELLRAAERRVRFRIDETSGKTLIYVVDASTGEIVRQIPPEQLVALGQRFGTPGAILDAQA